MEKPSEEEDLQKTNLLSNRSSNKSAKNELPDINAHKNQTYVQGGSDSEEEEELTFTEFVKAKKQNESISPVAAVAAKNTMETARNNTERKESSNKIT